MLAEQDAPAMAECREHYGFLLIVTVEKKDRTATAACEMTLTEATSIDAALTQLKTAIKIAKSAGAAAVSSQIGRDWWSDLGAARFLIAAAALAEAAEIPLCHATLRGGLFSSPFRTATLLENVPGTKLHVDLSAWCCGRGRLFSEEAGDPFWPGLLTRVSAASIIVSGHLSNGTESVIIPNISLPCHFSLCYFIFRTPVSCMNVETCSRLLSRLPTLFDQARHRCMQHVFFLLTASLIYICAVVGHRRTTPTM